MKRRMVKIICLGAIVLSAALVGNSWGKVIYVDDDAPVGGDGSSWTKAYRYLQDALVEARSPGGAIEIHVAQGLYKPDRDAAHPDGTGNQDMAFFYVLYGVAIRGGFAGVGAVDPNERDIVRYPSVLSGDLAGNDVEIADPRDAQGEPTRVDNSYHVVRNTMNIPRGGGREGPPGLSKELDGFVITAGHALSQGKSGLANFPGGGIELGGSPYVPYTSVPKVIIRNCTIVGNYAWRGGAIACSYANVAIADCTIIQNVVPDRYDGGAPCGGGLYAIGSGVELSNCRFERNYAGCVGGAVRGEDSDVTATACQFDHNSGGSGGAVSLTDIGTVDAIGEFVGCTFTFNIAHSTFPFNVAGSSGQGGALLSWVSVQLRNCLFSGNHAVGTGGAISEGSNMLATDCVFSGNTAGEGGGAIHEMRGELQLLNCTFHGNRAPQGRFLFCGPYYAGNHVYVDNSIVSDGGDEIWGDPRGTITIRYTDLPGGLAAIQDPGDKLIWGPGNMDADPCFVSPGCWDPNGTPDDPMDDIWLNGDYHLKSQAGRWDPNSQSWIKDDITSPCIDAGDPNSPVGEEPQPNGGRVNMGAYGGTAEASKSESGEFDL